MLVAQLSFSLTSPVCTWEQILQLPCLGQDGTAGSCPQNQQGFVPLPSCATPLLGKGQMVNNIIVLLINNSSKEINSFFCPLCTCQMGLWGC